MGHCQPIPWRATLRRSREAVLARRTSTCEGPDEENTEIRNQSQKAEGGTVNGVR